MKEKLITDIQRQLRHSVDGENVFFHQRKHEYQIIGPGLQIRGTYHSPLQLRDMGHFPKSHSSRRAPSPAMYSQHYHRLLEPLFHKR